MSLHNTIEVQRGQSVTLPPFPERRPIFWVLGESAGAQELVQTASRNSGSEADPCRVVWVHDPGAVQGRFAGLPSPAQLWGFTTDFDGAVSRVFPTSGFVPDDVEVLAAFTAAMAGGQ